MSRQQAVQPLPDTIALGTVDGILEVRSLRLRWIRHTLHADGDITVAADLPVAAAHDIAHHAEEHLLDALPRLAAAVIHVSLDVAQATTESNPTP